MSGCAGLRIVGTGCCLMDYLYTRVDFSAPAFQAVLSRTIGDGGLRPGALVFSEDFEAYCGQPFQSWLKSLTLGRAPDAENLGGPAVVALIHAAQLLYDRDVSIAFHAGHGADAGGTQMREIIGRTPVDRAGYVEVPGASPSTVVLSDPTCHGGKGERTFINTIGAAGTYSPEQLDAAFFDADICLYGATALVPQLHDALDTLLRKSRERGAVNVVGTVYDFRNEQRHPDRPWPLGDRDSSFPLIDLLVCDREEALRISGANDVASAIDCFLKGGVGSVVVTHGAKAVHLSSRGGLFAELPLLTLPVSEAVDRDLEAGGREGGDTTGCGDNFLGGVLTSLALQMLNGKREGCDLIDACSWGAASGGYACFYTGGTYVEPQPGQKRGKVRPYYEAYRRQIGRKALAG